MELKGITKQIIDFQKASFEQTFAGVTALQDCSGNLMDGLLSQSPWINRRVEETNQCFNENCQKCERRI